MHDQPGGDVLAPVGILDRAQDLGSRRCPPVVLRAAEQIGCVLPASIGLLVEEGGNRSLPVVLPIPAPGWVQRIATLAWPSDLAAHMAPPAITNQCVAGALATWALMHVGGARWDHPPPLFGNAIDLFGVARAQGFVVSEQPAPGEMVVYGSSYGVFGHIATVVAVEPGRYEVIEQNFLDFNPSLEPHWATFDLRSVAWPDAAVVGFVVAPGA